MCGERLTSGRLTNHEMSEIRRSPHARRHWQYVWALVADPFHPRSTEDWQAFQRAKAEALEQDEGDDGPDELPV